jgi:hypothetical protein
MRAFPDGKAIGVLNSSVYQTPFHGRSRACRDAPNSSKQLLDADRNAELANVPQCRSAAEMFETMKGEGCEVSAADMTIRMKSEFHISPCRSSVVDSIHDHSK